MALVLRKATLPKNLSLLKCVKGRQIAYATNRTNTAALSKAFPFRRWKNVELCEVNGSKTVNLKTVPKAESHSAQSKLGRMHYCMSCPSLGTAAWVQRNSNGFGSGCLSQNYSTSATSTTLVPARLSFSVMSYRPSLSNINRFNIQHACNISTSTKCDLKTTSKTDKDVCPCPCPGGCCPCPTCLPPPCNTPPKCIQYMTGYYYYPYGFWFCGPYHVTGTCTPVGPACPGSSCGPCAPCPKCIGCPCKCCACMSPSIAGTIGTPMFAQETTDCSYQTPLPNPNQQSKSYAWHQGPNPNQTPFTQSPPNPAAFNLPSFNHSISANPPPFNHSVSASPPPPSSASPQPICRSPLMSLESDSKQHTLQYKPISPLPQAEFLPKAAAPLSEKTPAQTEASSSVISKFFPFPSKSSSSKSKDSMNHIAKCMICPILPINVETNPVFLRPTPNKTSSKKDKENSKSSSQVKRQTNKNFRSHET